MMKLIRFKLPFVARLIDAHILIPKQLRSGYQRYYTKTYMGTIRTLLVMATLFYTGFGLLDLFLLSNEALNEYLTPILKIRYLYGLPVLLLLTAVAFTQYFAKLHQVTTAVYVVMVQVFLWWMMVTVPESDVQQTYFSGLMLTQMASLIVSRLQFIPAICSGAVMLLFLFIGYFQVSLKIETVVIQWFFYGAVAIIGLTASFSNEMHIRHHYFKLRDITSEHLRLKKDNDSLHYLAQYDPLTGLANRRYFDEMYAKEWRRAERNRLPLSLCMIDIDHFKQYNDHYGHQTGDQCLIKLASLLGEFAKRTGDLAARYGGEEFVLLLPGIESDEAGLVADRICKGLVQLEIPHEYSAVAQCVTVSIGVASERPMPGLTDDAALRETLLRKADLALYDAKHHGKNRAAVARAEDEGALIVGKSVSSMESANKATNKLKVEQSLQVDPLGKEEKVKDKEKEKQRESVSVMEPSEFIDSRDNRVGGQRSEAEEAHQSADVHAK